MLLVSMLFSAAVIASACGNNGSAAQSAGPSQIPASAVDVTLTTASPSAGPFYLDGTYSLRFKITHPSEQCLLAIYARKSGESIGTALISEVIPLEYTGTYPLHSESFAWDDAQFYADDYSIVSESACRDVQVELTSKDPLAVSSMPPPTTTPDPSPSMSLVPTPTPSAESIANGNICTFVRSTLVSRLASEGSLPYEFGQISLSQFGKVYRDWAKEGTALLAKNQAATAAIIKEAKRLIAIAERTATAADAGKSKTALDLGLTALDTKIYTVCGGY